MKVALKCVYVINVMLLILYAVGLLVHRTR